MTSIPVFEKIVLFGFGDVTFQKAAQERTAFFLGFIWSVTLRRFRVAEIEAGIRTMSVAGLPGRFASRHTSYVPFKLIFASQFKITEKRWIGALEIFVTDIYRSISIT